MVCIRLPGRLATKLTWGRFVKFCIVGGIGAGVQSAAFYILYHIVGIPDFVDPLGFFPIPWALGWAILVAVSWNYIANSKFTFREVKDEREGKSG